MTVMQVRGIRLCPTHRTAVVRLDDSDQRVTMTFAADVQEAGRLARVIERGPRACHPAFDFVAALLGSFEAGLTRVVLDDVQGEGIAGLVYVGWGGAELPVPCYPPDAIAMALRTGVPIYATAAALEHAEPAPVPESGEVTAWLDGVRPGDFEAGGDAGERPGEAGPLL
jgi:bifunctional DNase/RNase